VAPPQRALFEFCRDFFIPSGYDYVDHEDLAPALTALQEFGDHLQYWWGGKRTKRMIMK
jgi:hypothetical protein